MTLDRTRNIRDQQVNSEKAVIEIRKKSYRIRLINIPSVADLLVPMLKCSQHFPNNEKILVKKAAISLGFDINRIGIPKPINSNQSFAIKSQEAINYLLKIGYLSKTEKIISITDEGRDKLLSSSDTIRFQGFHEPKIKYKAKSYIDPKIYPEKIERNLPKMEMHKIISLWENAIEKYNPRNGSDSYNSAIKVIQLISLEWERRAKTLPEEYFKWPSTDAWPGKRGLYIDKEYQEGLLSFLGYHVGRTNGSPTALRQNILSYVFENSLPLVNNKEYMDAWGNNKSSKRLKKMANSLASFICNAKRRNDDRYDEAIKEWGQDLKFLYDRYYVGYFFFGWPHM